MRLLIALSLILAILGLFLLAHASEFQQPLKLKISQISEEHEGAFIETKGEIAASYFRNGHLFLTLCDSSCIKVVIFSSDLPRIATHSNPWLLSPGDRILISGTVERYRGSIEVVAESLEVI